MTQDLVRSRPSRSCTSCLGTSAAILPEVPEAITARAAALARTIALEAGKSIEQGRVEIGRGGQGGHPHPRRVAAPGHGSGRRETPSPEEVSSFRRERVPLGNDAF